MLQVRTLWLGAAAPVLAVMLVMPAPGQERPRDPPPGQPKGGVPDTVKRQNDRLGPAVDKGGSDRRGLSKSPDYHNQLSFLGDVVSRLESDYVSKPDMHKLMVGAVRGMLKELDPHSEYLDPQEFREMQVGTGGVDIDLVEHEGRVYVGAVRRGTLAEREGLSQGDVITHIDGKHLGGLSQKEVRRLLAGQTGSTVALRVLAGGGGQPRDLEARRELLRRQPTVAASVERDVGYISISSFGEGTSNQLAKAVESLQGEIGSKLKGYVIDLRNNQGGLLDQSVLSADVFLESGLIVELRGRETNDRRTARAGDAAKGAPLVILVNGVTAAGAEIMAAALQDNKRARVLGARTAGSGTVQTIIPLGALLGSKRGDGALRLTTFHHYTPSGKWLEGNGIEPDVAAERAAPGDGPPSLVPADKSRDAQLQRALSLLRDGS